MKNDLTLYGFGNNYSNEINTNFKLKQVKKNSKVLFETFNDGYLTGLSENTLGLTVCFNSKTILSVFLLN